MHRPVLVLFSLIFSFHLSQPIQAADNDNLACAIWPAIASTATKGQVEAFLSECQSGIYHRLAKARLGELKGSAVQTDTGQRPDLANIPDSDEPANTLYNRAKDYQYGENGKPKDYRKALELFYQAAKKGHAKSMTDVGWMHEKGYGTAQNSKIALQWYKQAADKGESMAINNMGWMYSQGKVIEKDYKKAVRLYRRAIALGEPLAMTNLGWMYETGKGVQQDDNQAFTYYKQAADAGDTQGLHNTGWMYATGRGTIRDPKKGARAVYDAMRKGNTFSRDQMTGNYSIWPNDFRQEMQKLLKSEGFYNGNTSGKFDQATIDAVKRAAR